MAPAASCGSAGAWEPSLPARGELASNAVLRSSLSGAILLHRQVTQLRGDGGVEIATDVLAAVVPTAWEDGGFQSAFRRPARVRPPDGRPLPGLRPPPRPQSAWAPLVACPPQDGVSLAMNPSGVDGVGL